MGGNTFVCTSYEGCLSGERKVGNGVSQGDFICGILFKFYLNEVSTKLADLPLGYKLSGNRVNIFCYADDIVLLAPTEKVLQFILDTPAPKLENVSLKINAENFYNIVFKHKKRNFLLTCRYKVSSWIKLVNTFTWESQACTSDMERPKRTFLSNIIQYTNNSVVLITTSYYVLSECTLCHFIAWKPGTWSYKKRYEQYISSVSLGH